MNTSKIPYLARVNQVITGKNGTRYAKCTMLQENIGVGGKSVTFTINNDVWGSQPDPAIGAIVILREVRTMENGLKLRAYRARFCHATGTQEVLDVQVYTKLQQEVAERFPEYSFLSGNELWVRWLKIKPRGYNDLLSIAGDVTLPDHFRARAVFCLLSPCLEVCPLDVPAICINFCNRNFSFKLDRVKDKNNLLELVLDMAVTFLEPVKSRAKTNPDLADITERWRHYNNILLEFLTVESEDLADVALRGMGFQSPQYWDSNRRYDYLDKVVSSVKIPLSRKQKADDYVRQEVLLELSQNKRELLDSYRQSVIGYLATPWSWNKMPFLTGQVDFLLDAVSSQPKGDLDVHLAANAVAFALTNGQNNVALAKKASRLAVSRGFRIENVSGSILAENVIKYDLLDSPQKEVVQKELERYNEVRQSQQEKTDAEKKAAREIYEAMRA